MPVAIYASDLLLRVQKGYGYPTMPLEQAQKELAQRGEVEEEEATPDFPTSGDKERVESAESIVPLAVVDPKEK